MPRLSRVRGWLYVKNSCTAPVEQYLKISKRCMQNLWRINPVSGFTKYLSGLSRLALRRLVCTALEIAR